MSLDLRKLDPRTLEPLSGSKVANADDHFVELYDDDSALLDSVRTFISIGIAEGEAAVVIAAPSHREAIERGVGRSIDLDVARHRGLFVSIDAEETLSLFMEGDRPDPDRVDSVIGEVLDRASRDGRKVRVFGEMVAVLCSQGNVAGALALEDEWNRLAKARRFRLFCGYPSTAFAGDEIASLTAVCNRHSHVVLAAR